MKTTVRFVHSQTQLHLNASLVSSMICLHCVFMEISVNFSSSSCTVLLMLPHLMQHALLRVRRLHRLCSRVYKQQHKENISIYCTKSMYHPALLHILAVRWLYLYDDNLNWTVQFIFNVEKLLFSKSVVMLFLFCANTEILGERDVFTNVSTSCNFTLISL